MSRYFLSLILTAFVCLTMIGCGASEESTNPVDKDVPTADISEGESVDPSTLFNDDEETTSESSSLKTPPEEGSGDSDATGTDGSSQTSFPTLEQPKLKKPVSE